MEPLRGNPFPVTETFYKGDDLHRSFTYCRQSLDGASDRWIKMIADINSSASSSIIALIVPGRELVWSTDAPAHMALEKAIGSDEWNAKIEAWSGARIANPYIAIYSDDLSLQTDFKDYLLRSGIEKGVIRVEGSTYRGQRTILL